jgi:hypothetical protein
MIDGYSVKSLRRGRSNASLKVEAEPYREGAFLLVRKQAVIAETHAAKRTIKLLAMENLIPALAAFYSSIDQLKHQTFISTRNEPVCRWKPSIEIRMLVPRLTSKQNGMSLSLVGNFIQK